MKKGTLILKPIEFKSEDFNICKENGLSKKALNAIKKEYDAVIKFTINEESGNIEVVLYPSVKRSN